MGAKTSQPYLEWRDEFSIGIPAIDHEHQELIGMINQLHDEIGLDPSGVERFLGEIYAKISSHFALEESVMRQSGYGEYKAHKEDHESLLEEIRSMMELYERDETFDDKQLKAGLASWFSEHFRTMDARFHRHFGH